VSDLEEQLRAVLAGRAGLPVAAGDPVRLVEARMRRRTRRRQITAAALAAVGVTGIAIGVAVAVPSPGGTSRPVTPVSPTTGPTTPTPAATNAAALGLVTPGALAVEPDGSLLITDAAEVLRRLPDGELVRLAGTVQPGFSGDGGPATAAQLSSPLGLAVGPDGTVYIADGGNNTVRAISPDGIIHSVAAHAGLTSVAAVAVGPDRELYIADGNRILRIAADGSAQLVVGGAADSSPPASSPAFPPSVSALAFDPTAMAFDRAGDLYIASFATKVLLRLAPDHTMSVVPPDTYASDGGLTPDPDGSVLLADYGQFGIDRLIGDTLTTVTDFIKDTPSQVRDSIRPAGVAVAPDGTLYVSDPANGGGAQYPLIAAQKPGGTWSVILTTGDPAVGTLSGRVLAYGGPPKPSGGGGVVDGLPESGMTVTMTRTDGQAVTSVVAGVDGTYSFQLPAGTYTVATQCQTATVNVEAKANTVQNLQCNER
jgi:sugar lactone lactonase YvrE